MRGPIRLLLMVVSTLVLYTVYRAGRLATRGARRLRWRNRMVGIWARTISRIAGMRTTVMGERPEGAYILVANHVSYVDILLLSSCVDVAFVSKAELLHWPFLGGLSASVGTIFIDRSSRRDAVRVSGEIERTLQGGLAVALFPEGTSTDGTIVLPFKSTLLEVAARADLPVHHAVIRYRQPEVTWGGDTHFVKHVWGVLRLPRIDASLRFGGTVHSRDRKELARELHREISSALSS